MKIGIYDPYLDTLTGGEKYMLTAASCLAEKHNVSIFWDVTEEQLLKTEIKRKFGMDLSHIPFVRNLFARNISFLKRFQLSRKYDLILLLSDGSIPFVFSQLVLHFQTPMEWLPNPNFKTKIKLSRVKTIICNSQFTKSFIDKKLNIKSVVLYPPVSLIKKTTQKKENIILHVGRFGIYSPGSSYKKQEMLIDAFKSLVKKGLKEWKFVLVMSVKPEDLGAVERLQQETLKYPIEFIVNPDNHTLVTVYSKARIYWHASGFEEDLQKNPDRAEHFGISTVEAMSAGAVPIVFNAGGQAEIVEDKKNGFVWDTRDELLKYTQEVVSNKMLQKTISQEAEKRAQFFSIDRFCESLQRIIP